MQITATNSLVTYFLSHPEAEALLDSIHHSGSSAASEVFESQEGNIESGASLSPAAK